MVELDIRILARQFDDRFTPDAAGFEHVSLVDAGQFLASFLGGAKGAVGDAADFGFVIGHVVPAFPAACAVTLPLVAEVDVAIELAHHEKIDTARQFRLERGQVLETRKSGSRAQIGKQPEFAPQAKDRLFGTMFARERVAFRIADSTEEDCVRCARHFQRFGGKRMTMPLVGNAAHVPLEQGELRQRQRIEHLERLARNFGSDAVTRQYRNLHVSIRPRRCLSTVLAARTSARVSARR